MNGGRLPKQIKLGNPERAVRRGSGGKQKSESTAYRAKSGRSGGLGSEGVGS